MNECLVITYHYIRDTKFSDFPNIKALSVSTFHNQLDWLSKNYQIIDYLTFYATLVGKRKFGESTALLTFDDGFIDHYKTVFPILMNRGLSGVFFVPTACLVRPRMLNVHRVQFLLASLGAKRLFEEIERGLRDLSLKSSTFHSVELETRLMLYHRDIPSDKTIKQLLNHELPYHVSEVLLKQLFETHLGDEQEFADQLYCTPLMLKEMASAGVSLGGHTWNHRPLSQLSVEDQSKEITDAPQMIQELTGQREIPFCFPYGLPATYSVDTLRLLESAGYASAFTVIPGSVKFGFSSPLELPRTDTCDLICI